MKTKDDLLCTIALSMVPAVGDINARKLIENLGSASAVFNESYAGLIRIPGIGKTIAANLSSDKYIKKADAELDYIRKHGIRIRTFYDEDYPGRLKHCADAPLIIYSKGNSELNEEKIISIVGTRNITGRGKDICKKIINELAAYYPEIVISSGLAYGVDITAHKASLEAGIKTIAVLGHGFKTIYPSAHLPVARQIIESGALLTDFPSFESPERNNFLKRNRIIAGISDATLIIESGRKGGAMVTADIAASYDREVLAVPGFPGFRYSEGCNLLIKSNRAALVESADDLIYCLGWEKGKPEASQKKLFSPELSSLEQDIMMLFNENEYLPVSFISNELKKAQHQLSSALLKLEFSGFIQSMPGNIYRKNL